MKKLYTLILFSSLATAGAINNLTIVGSLSSNQGCSLGTSGGTMSTTSTSATIDFGSSFGTTETCGVRLATEISGGSGFTTFNPGIYIFKGAICSLQGSSDGCNPQNPASLSDIITLDILNLEGTQQIGISDILNGGSFSFVMESANVGTPEPTSFLMIGGGFMILGLFKGRMKGKNVIN